EAVRKPLEEGRVTISRAQHAATCPADFILCAAMNPCPCGWLGDPNHQCKCAAVKVEKYLGRISGPLLDRIDLHLEVPAVPYEELSRLTDGTSTASMREQVDKARAVQTERFRGRPVRLNGRMTPRQIREFCRLGEDARGM